MSGGWVLHIDDDGRLTIPELGLEVIAEQLPAGEAGDLAALRWSQSLAAGLESQLVDEPSPGGRPPDCHDRRCAGKGGSTGPCALDNLR